MDGPRCNHYYVTLDHQRGIMKILLYPLKRVFGLECNQQLLHSFAFVSPELEVSTGVGVVHEVELGEDTACIAGFIGYREISRRSRKEAIIALFTQTDGKKVITHVTVLEEMGMLLINW